MPPSFWRRCLATALGLFNFPFVLTAQEPSAASADYFAGEPTHLDPYEINDPAFLPERGRPASTYKVDGGMLASLNLVNTEDALKYAPNVFVRKRFIGDQNGALVIRGTHTAQSARSLVLADGLVLSNLLGSGHGFSPRWGLIAPEEIERVEVIYGPYSALYSGNALGGVVLFTTGMPSAFLASSKVSFFFNDYAEYSTADIFTGHQGSITVGDRNGKFSYFVFLSHLQNKSNPTDFRTILASATSSASGGLAVTGAIRDRDPRERDRLVYGAYGFENVSQDQLKVKVGYDVTPDLSLSAAAVLYRRDADSSAESYLRDSSGNAVTTGTVRLDGRRFTLGAADFGYSRREEMDLLLSAGVRGRVGGWDVAALGSAFIVLEDAIRSSSQSGSAADAGGPGLLLETGSSQGWTNFDLKAARAFETNRGSKHGLILGYHFDRYVLQTGQYSTAHWLKGSRVSLRDGQEGQTTAHAFFVQDAWELNSRWTVTMGLREESWRSSRGRRKVDTAAGRVTTELPGRDESHLSPKISFAWKPAAEWTVRLSAARAYRFPTVGELYQGNTLADGTVTNNDPNLRTETAISKDLTVEKVLRSGSLRLSLFEDDVADTIFSQTNTTTQVTNFQNIPDVLTRGAEFALDRKHFLFESLDLQASLTFTDSEIGTNPAFPASQGKRFPRISRWRAAVFATYHATPELSFTAGWRYASGQYNTLDNIDTRATYGGVSGYSLIDFRLRYQLPQGLALALGVDNAFRDKYYQSHNLLQRAYFVEASWTY